MTPYRAHVPIRNSKFLKLLTFQMPKFPLVKNLRGKNSLDFPFLCTCRVTLTELQSRNSLTTELHTLSVPPASFTRASLFRLGFPCFRFGPAVAIGLQAPQGGRRASSRQEARARAQPEFDAAREHGSSVQLAVPTELHLARCANFPWFKNLRVTLALEIPLC